MSVRALLGSIRHQGISATWWQRRWHSDPRNEHRLQSLDLPLNAVVVDGGGFRGEFAKNVLRSCPTAELTIFEPETLAASQLSVQFEGNPRIRVVEAALWDEDTTLALKGDGLAASVGRYLASPKDSHPVRAIDVATILADLGAVSLVKLNVEGAEYAILNRMVSSGAVISVDQLLIQFHRVPAATVQYRQVADLLRQTHERSWRWPWTWELWTRRSLEDSRDA